MKYENGNGKKSIKIQKSWEGETNEEKEKKCKREKVELNRKS